MVTIPRPRPYLSMIIKYTPEQARYQAALAAYLELDTELTAASIHAWIDGKLHVLACATRQLYNEWYAAHSEAQASRRAMFVETGGNIS